MRACNFFYYISLLTIGVRYFGLRTVDGGRGETQRRRASRRKRTIRRRRAAIVLRILRRGAVQFVIRVRCRLRLTSVAAVGARIDLSRIKNSFNNLYVKETAPNT